MHNEEINKRFDWNRDYIMDNLMDSKILQTNGIELARDDEIYVKHPDWRDYYVSQYGNALSLKKDKCKKLALIPGGGGYYYFKFSDLNNGVKPTSIGAHRATADVFCPDFWGGKQELEAHHIDRVHTNNNYRNLILLPDDYHRKIHRKIKEIALLRDNRLISYTNILDLIRDTGLSIDDIFLADTVRKPINTIVSGEYTVFNINGNYVCFKGYPEK